MFDRLLLELLVSKNNIVGTQQAWIELSTLEGPDYFGEAAMLSRGVRHATVIADSNVEILVLTKVDFDLKIDRDARDVVAILVSNYPKDKQILRYVFCRSSKQCTTCTCLFGPECVIVGEVGRVQCWMWCKA